jgi:hypothetical protein
MKWLDAKRLADADSRVEGFGKQIRGRAGT